MKLKNLFIASIAVASFGLVGCDDFGDINRNPNYPSDATTYSQFLYSSRFVKYFVCNSYYYDIWTQQYPGYLSESKNNQFGNLECTFQLSTGNYYASAIRMLNAVIDQNTDPDSNNPYVLAWGEQNNQIAICRTLRAFYFMSMTDVLGPTPYTEAILGAKENNWYPKFDNTDVIYEGLDKDLAEAYAMFNDKSDMKASEYDIFFQGDVKKWKKFNATLRMMMAIKMKDVDPVNGKARFAAAYADGGMTDYSDSFTYTYDKNSKATFNFAPMYSTAYGIDKGNQNHVPNKVIVDSLKHYQDPRLFTYCDVSETSYKGKAGAFGDKDFRSYHGVPFGLYTQAETTTQAKYCCGVGPKYCRQTATYGVITTARALLVEAEAALMGWIEADPAELYYAGIKASFEFENYLEAQNLGRSNFTYDLDAYCSQELVKFADEPQRQLHQILAQRWLAGYMTDGVEAWADWRINNYPMLPIYPYQKDNHHETYPYRMQYSDDDKGLNPDNCQAAINAYLGGEDKREKRIWWDVADNVSPDGELLTPEELEYYNPNKK